MEDLLFSHVAADTAFFYAGMRRNSPVHYDPDKKQWNLYSYHGCKTFINAECTQIPNYDAVFLKLNSCAGTLRSNLARLGNPPHHAGKRQSALQLFNTRREVSIPVILDRLISGKNEFDWMDNVARKLFVFSLLEHFSFSSEDSAWIAEQIGKLTKLMIPDPDEQQIEAINQVSPLLYAVVQNRLQNCMLEDWEENRDVYISNLIGLLIQSYDAGRGLLGNAMLQLLKHKFPGCTPGELSFFRKTVIEVLRYDSPIQNTRRVITRDFTFEGHEIKNGATLLLVLASANRDHNQFTDPDNFDIERPNNTDHLTFGSGLHTCVAGDFSVRLVAEALYYLFEKYDVHLEDTNISYLPLVNARIPQQLTIRLTKK